MKTVYIALFLVFGVSAQTVVNVPALTVSAEATAALNATLSSTFSGISASLTAPVLLGDTTINVVSTANIGPISAISIEGEAMKITTKTTTSFTVTRAYYGTIAAPHPVTAQVNELKYPTFIRAFMQAVNDWVGGQMDQAVSSTIAAQNAVIANATATKISVKAVAVQ